MYFHIVSSTTIGFGDLGLLFDGNAIRDNTVGRNFLNTILIYLGLGAFGAYSGVLIDTFKNMKNFVDEVLCGQLCDSEGDKKWDLTSYDGFVDPKDSFFDSTDWDLNNTRRMEDPAPRWYEYIKHAPTGEPGVLVAEPLGTDTLEEQWKVDGDSETTLDDPVNPAPEEKPVPEENLVPEVNPDDLTAGEVAII